MKKLLLLCFCLLGLAIPTRAANPSFGSFNTNDFIVAPPFISLSRINTGGTNVFNYTTNVFENSTVIFTNTFITNINSVIVNTNTFISNEFVTNIVDNSTVYITNSFLVISNTVVTINGTNVSAINPTIGRIPYNQDGTNFGDSALYYIDTSTVGADQVFSNDLGVTNLVTGGFVISVDSGLGYGILTNAPFSTFAIWTNDAANYYPTQPEDQLDATNIIGHLATSIYGAFRVIPTLFTNLVAGENDLEVLNVGAVSILSSDPSAQVRLSSGNGYGSYLTLSYLDDSGNGFHLINGDELTDINSFHLYLSGGDWNPTISGQTMLLYFNGNGWAEIGRFGGPTNVVVAPLTINPTDGYLPYRSNATTFGDSPIQRVAGTSTYIHAEGGNVLIPFNLSGLDNFSFDNSKIQFNQAGAIKFMVVTNSGYDGSGTHFLADDGTYKASGGATINPTDGFLPYRSNATTFGDSPFTVLDPDEVQQSQVLDANTKGYITYRAATNSSDVTVSGRIGGVLSTTYIGAGQGIDAPISVMINGNLYFQVRSSGEAQFIGFDDGTGTNYSRGAIYDTGTNGAVVFESQSAGSAGVARPFNFTGSDLRIMGYPLGASDFPMLAASHTTECYWTNIHLTSVATGTNTLFTVPSNYRLNLRDLYVLPSTNNTPYTVAVGISGTTYRLASLSTIQTNGGTLNPNQYCYDSGETVVLIASGLANDVFLSGLVFTDTIPYKTIKLTSLSVGTNYVYTVPSGKYAVGRSGSGASFTSATYVNGTAGTVAYQWNYLLSGETTGTRFIGGNQLTLAGSANACQVLVMQPGDAFVIQVNDATAGQLAYVTLFEGN